MEELVYRLPFKMKMQTLMEDNKPMDEWTKEDKEKREKEDKLEIEKNFPSYFDEFQRVIFSGIIQEDEQPSKVKKVQSVKIEKILTYLIDLDKNEVNEKRSPADKRRALVKARLNMLNELINLPNSQDDLTITDRNNEWMRDISNYLREELTHAVLPSVMNVTDVRLESEFSFYHDPLPQEARLVYEPLAKLIQRLDWIMQEYESPILQDAVFLANYMLVSFSPKNAPLMKLLTGLELILNKLEEWEVYASKSLNSCDSEMTLLKQLIIRYRKIQILSWRNLLQWRKAKMVREDFNENFVRLAHTLERQVFDRQYYIIQGDPNAKKAYHETTIELKIMEVLDLFMRDSSLGQFQSRLSFLQLLLTHFKAKAKQLKLIQKKQVIAFSLLDGVDRVTKKMNERLRIVINILDFVSSYYA